MSCLNPISSEISTLPNIILLPHDRQSQPLHIRAPSWSALLRLLAQSSTSRLETTSAKYFKLRTVVQFTRVSEVVSALTTLLYAPQLTSRRDFDAILWFSIDQPVLPNIPDGVHDSSNPNILPWSYTQSSIPALPDHHRYFKPCTIPATDNLPYPTLPITFPDVALYLQAALEESEQDIYDDTGGKRLAQLVRQVSLPTRETRPNFGKNYLESLPPP